MTIQFGFVWIDDTPERAEKWIGALDGSLRGELVETKLEVVGLTNNFIEELDRKVGEWIANSPNLIMLDHNFSKVQKRLFGMHGSALAHLLRIQLPKTPIVCVSGQRLDSDDFNAEDISEYTYLFDVNQINSESDLETLFAIAKDFHLLCFPEKVPVRHALVDALKAPEADKQALISILPEEFEAELVVHSTSPHRIARWVLNVLMKRPGFLYDALETATLLGLTEAAFLTKIKPRFEDARYCGPFATDTRPLWWTSKLTEVLYAALPEHAVLPSQEAGRRFAEIVEDDFSRCGVTNEHTPAPDVVAYTDATTASERKAVRHRFAIPLSEEASSLLGFPTRLRIRNERRGN